MPTFASEAANEENMDMRGEDSQSEQEKFADSMPKMPTLGKDDPMKVLVDAMSAQFSFLNTKVDDLSGKLATKEDLSDLRQELKGDVKKQVTSAVKPVIDKVDSLTKRVVKLEATPPVSAARPSGFDVSDPAFKRIDFTGFTSTDAQARVLAMKQYCARFPAHTLLAVANKYKGPHNNRTLKTSGYAEFTDRDAAREFLKEAKGEVLLVGSTVKVKTGKTQLAEQRDWALFKAKEILEKAASGREVKLLLADRAVEVDSEAALAQRKEDTKGHFTGEFAHLHLP